MNGLPEQFKVNLNQNLWGLLVSFVALGTAERYQLRTLFCFSAALALVMVISVAVTTIAYTCNYYKGKLWKQG